MIQISARNVFQAEITKIIDSPINDEIEVTTPDGNRIVAIADKSSIASLGLTLGKRVYAFVKAPWVILAINAENMRSSARNQLHGTVIGVKSGTVNAEVAVQLTGKTIIHAIVTNDAAKGLNLSPGVHVTALIKASHVVLGVIDDH